MCDGNCMVPLAEEMLGSEVLHLGRELGVRDAEGQRVTQVRLNLLLLLWLSFCFDFKVAYDFDRRGQSLFLCVSLASNSSETVEVISSSNLAL